MIAEITSALSGMNAAVQIGKALVGAHTDVKVNQEISKMLDAVLEAKIGLLDASETIGKLQDELRQAQSKLADVAAWNEKAALYELVTTVGGAVVYGFKGQPAHYACPSCFELKQIHFLQSNRTYAGTYHCTGCKSTFPVNVRTNPKIPSVHGYR